MDHDDNDGARAAFARLRRVGQAVRLFTAAAGGVMLLGMVWVWTDEVAVWDYARKDVGASAAPATLPARAYWIALALATIPAGLFVYAMARLAKLFDRFGRGRVLELENAAALRQVGWLLIAFGLASPFVRAMQSVVFTWANPAGRRQLSVMLDPGIFAALAAGGALVAFGLVLRETIRLHDENQSFV